MNAAFLSVARSLKSIVSSVFVKTSRRSALRHPIIPHIEQLDERILPTAASTTWTAANAGLWSNAANWNNGVPTSTKVAVFTDGGNGNCTYDDSVQSANNTVAGLISYQGQG